jgi:hypothetical protein
MYQRQNSLSMTGVTNGRDVAHWEQSRPFCDFTPNVNYTSLRVFGQGRGDEKIDFLKNLLPSEHTFAY